MQWLSDPTRRFIERPLFTESEMQSRVDFAISQFVGSVGALPVSTNVLDLLADAITDHYDPESDIASSLGNQVEGVTIFRPGKKPRIKISSTLLEEKYHRRRRMTIAHEIGHVLLHADLYVEERSLDLFSDSSSRGTVYCKAATMLPGVDWMEWQASFAAGCLLMPSSALRNCMEYHRGGRFHTALYLGDKDTHEAIEHVKNSFDVSRDAARVRLMQLGFIEEASVQRLPLF